MNQEKKELILNRMTRAQDTLSDAKILFENNRLFSTVNRIYYAMFYAVSGLLLTDTFKARHQKCHLVVMRGKEDLATGLCVNGLAS